MILGIENSLPDLRRLLRRQSADDGGRPKH